MRLVSDLGWLFYALHRILVPTEVHSYLEEIFSQGTGIVSPLILDMEYFKACI